MEQPPTMPAVELPLPGLWTGRATTGVAGDSSATGEWILVSPMDSARKRGRRAPDTRRASMVMPEPGGPRKRKLWPEPVTVQVLSGRHLATSIIQAGNRELRAGRLSGRCRWMLGRVFGLLSKGGLEEQSLVIQP